MKKQAIHKLVDGYYRLCHTAVMCLVDTERWAKVTCRRCLRLKGKLPMAGDPLDYLGD